MTLVPGSPEARLLNALLELSDDAALRLHWELAERHNRTGSARAMLFVGRRDLVGARRRRLGKDRAE